MQEYEGNKEKELEALVANLRDLRFLTELEISQVREKLKISQEGVLKAKEETRLVQEQLGLVQEQLRLAQEQLHLAQKKLERIKSTH